MRMKLKANAKLNLSLDICSKREDGYHILDSVMQSVSLCDNVNVEKAEKITVCYSDIGLCGSNDICYLAAKNFFEYAGIENGADIYIEKNIPCVAGMGGSSCDAAAVLMALNRLYETNYAEGTLIEIGLKVGADVPFCIVGGTCRVGGIGEILTPIKPLTSCAFLVVVMGKKPSTKEMYELIDSKPYRCGNTQKLIDMIEEGNLKGMCSSLSNAFEVVHSIRLERELLGRFSPLGIGLSGSGPAVFAVFENKAQADKARSVLETEGIAAYVVEPQEKGIIIE